MSFFTWVLHFELMFSYLPLFAEGFASSSIRHGGLFCLYFGHSGSVAIKQDPTLGFILSFVFTLSVFCGEVWCRGFFLPERTYIAPCARTSPAPCHMESSWGCYWRIHGRGGDEQDFPRRRYPQAQKVRLD
jgi:hypothetical protein